MTAILSRIAAEIAHTGFSALKRVRREGRARGLSEGQLLALPGELTRIRALRSIRRDWRREDPLLLAAYHRPRLAAERRRRREIEALPIAAAWRADRRAEVVQAAEYGYRESAALLAVAATIEAICRRARPTDWLIGHASTGRDGRRSSRYIQRPRPGGDPYSRSGYVTIRLSDHDLPDTPERDYNRSIGRGGNWDGEIVISRYQLFTERRDLASYLAEIETIYADATTE